MKRILGIVLIAFCTSLLTFAIAKKYIYKDTPFPSSDLDLKPVAYKPESPVVGGGYVDMQFAAEKSAPAVVHVNVATKGRVVNGGQDMYDPFSFFFGPRQSYVPPQQSSGSGVIISADGYIITNNHVVENADQVTVTLNDKKVLDAKVVAKDPSTDLAVLKVDETNLPFLTYGNSDNVHLGEWVLAVGYPLNLETTVTAGIISAKYRNLGINKNNNNGQSSPIESFLQTDAAVNPGNSGGALVNVNGELIGINTAIASPTGSYAGYSYAIPANLVKKVVEDLMKFGNVQRAYLGISYIDSRNASAEEISGYKLDKIDGVFIKEVIKGGSAESAGLKNGDVITKLDNTKVNTTAQMLEQIGRKRPGDKILITYIRNGKEGSTTATLKNQAGNTDIVKKEVQSLGANLKTLSKAEANKYNLQGGVIIAGIGKGAISEQTKIKQGFVITTINDENVTSVEQLNKMVAEADGKIQLGGIYPGYQGFYYYNINIED